MLGRMIEELLMTYHTRRQVTQKLMDMVKKPGIIDKLFGDFLSENEFIQNVEALLISINTLLKEREELPHKEGESLITFDTQSGTEQPLEEISFIAIDIDNQDSLANKYGDRLVRNLSWVVGLRIQKQIGAL